MLRKLIILVSLMVLSFSCDKNEPTKPNNLNPLVGTWKSTAKKENGSISNGDGSIMKFNSDNTGMAWFPEDINRGVSFSWNTNGNQLTYQYQPDFEETPRTFTYSINNNKLTFFQIDIDNGQEYNYEYIFTKQT